MNLILRIKLALISYCGLMFIAITLACSATDKKGEYLNYYFYRHIWKSVCLSACLSSQMLLNCASRQIFTCKTSKKCIFVFFACFRPYVGQLDDHIGWVTLMPFATIYPTDPRTNPSQFCKKYWELTVLKNVVFLRSHFGIFFSKKNIKKHFFSIFFFFCLVPWKAVRGSWVARMGRNFDVYPGFQPMRSWANTYAQDCML